MRRLYPIWAWGVFMPLAVISIVIGALVVVPVALLAGPSRGNRYVAAPWARIVARLTPIRVRVEGREYLRKGQPYVVVCNHQSQYDIIVIYGWSGLDLRWVMKKELRRLPFIGFGCALLGHIFVDRRNPESARAAINQVLPTLQGSTGVLFFPEGTRGPGGGRLLPFKKGAFRVAILKQWPLLPMTVTGTAAILPPRSLKLRPGSAKLIIHPPLDTRGLTMKDMPGLMARTREMIASGLEQERILAGRSPVRPKMCMTVLLQQASESDTGARDAS